MWHIVTLVVCQIPFAPQGADVTLPPPVMTTQAAPSGEPTPALPAANSRFSGPAQDANPDAAPRLPEEAPISSVLVTPRLAQQPSALPRRPTVRNSDTGLSSRASAPRGRPSAAQQILDAVKATAQLQGTGPNQISLTAAVARQGDRGRQSEIVRIYWEQFSLNADLQFAHDELAKLQQAPNPQDAAGSARLSAALRAAAARLAEAEMAALSSQYALAEVTGAPANHVLVATDAPLVGDYRTLYDTLFASSGGSNSLRRIDRTLPLRKALVDARAAAVIAADQSFAAQLQAYKQSQGGIDAVLKAADDLRVQRGSFLGAIRDYNLEVAEYAFATASPSADARKLVGMLIEVPNDATFNGQGRSAIVNSSIPAWQPSGGSRPRQPATSAVQPASGQATISSPPPAVLQSPEQPAGFNPNRSVQQPPPANNDSLPTIPFAPRQ